MGGGGHNATVDYLVAELSALDGYYTVETQAFSAWVHAGAQFSLLIDGVNTSAGVFDFTASGNVSGPIVVVPNGGCELVCFPVPFPFRCYFSNSEAHNHGMTNKGRPTTPISHPPLP